MDITRIADDELRQLAKIDGPKSMAAHVLRKVVAKRRKDRQVFAWRIGPYDFVGPVPDAETEAAIIRFAGDEDQ